MTPDTPDNDDLQRAGRYRVLPSDLTPETAASIVLTSSITDLRKYDVYRLLSVMELNERLHHTPQLKRSKLALWWEAVKKARLIILVHEDGT